MVQEIQTKQSHTDMRATQHIQLGRTDIKDVLDKYC